MTAFALHDMSAFPVVRLSGRALPAGYAAQWTAEMDALVARGQPFALLLLDSAENETHEDQKQRVLWLKANKGPFAAVCRGVIGVEPDRAQRLLKRAQGAMVALAFGLTFRVVASPAEAEALARRLLAGELPPNEPE